MNHASNSFMYYRSNRCLANSSFSIWKDCPFKLDIWITWIWKHPCSLFHVWNINMLGVQYRCFVVRRSIVSGFTMITFEACLPGNFLLFCSTQQAGSFACILSHFWRHLTDMTALVLFLVITNLHQQGICYPCVTVNGLQLFCLIILQHCTRQNNTERIIYLHFE